MFSSISRVPYHYMFIISKIISKMYGEDKRTTIWGKYRRTIDSRGISLKIEIMEHS